MLLTYTNVRYLLFSLSFFPLLLFGQKNKQQVFTWYFGPQYGLDFSSGKPELLYDSAMPTYEAASTISDQNGNLLFYSNGGGREDGTAVGAIWNRNHEVMEGGDLGTTLGGGYSAAQGCVSFPKPGTTDEYYMFTVDEFETLQNEQSQFPRGKGLSYFEIDLTANGGLGKVTVSNQKLLEPSFEYLGATIHDNCEDYWVMAITGHYALAEDYDVADSIYIFPVTAAGIQAPMITPLPEGVPGMADEYGLIRIAPDGSGLTCGFNYFEFDNATGELGQARSLVEEAGVAAGFLSFSPNSRFLYNFIYSVIDTAEYVSAVQIDLEAVVWDTASINLGVLRVVNASVMGYPQMASNGLIYLPVQGGSTSAPTQLYAIASPDEKGSVSDFDYTGMNLSGITTKRFISFGTYTDHLFNSQADFTFDLGPDQLLSCTTAVSFTLEAPPGYSCHFWSDGSSGTSIEVTQAGAHWLEVYEGCKLGKDTVWIRFENDFFEVDLGPDTVFCENTNFLLPGGEWADATYTWEDDSTDSIRTLTEAGTYWVEAVRGVCVDSDTINLSMRNSPSLELFAEDQTLCLGDTFLLDFKTYYADFFAWEDGSEGKERLISSPGNYKIIAGNECATLAADVDFFYEDCEPPCPVYMPNAFSPDGDGANDEFKVFSSCALVDEELRIYSRWGELLFASDEYEKQWDGYMKGKALQTGVYVYLFKYGIAKKDGTVDRFLLSGDLLLVR